MDSQIHGGDVSENYLSVVHDVTLFRILILVLIVFGLKAEMWIWRLLSLMVILKKKYSWSVHAEENAILELNKCFYGLVQTAR